MHVCAYLALNYITSSFFFFEKTIVVAGGEPGMGVVALDVP